MFEDRKDAGKKLAEALEKYANQNVLVLAIPRGGVEPAFEAACHLNADFSLLISRKLPFPDNPESGFGAVAEDGSTFIINGAARWLSATEIDVIKNKQIQEIKRRIKVLRGGRPIPELKGRTVILVDDGLAMGSTMRASILMCRKRDPDKIIAAVPVAGRDVAKQIQPEVDELIVLESPPFFRAVAQVYRDWHDVPDQDVLEMMQKWEKTN
jgi:putative phosphoribosyl transferase